MGDALGLPVTEAQKSALSGLTAEDSAAVCKLWNDYAPGSLPESVWLEMSEAIVEAYFKPFAQHTALSARHAAEEKAKADKLSARAEAKALKESDKLAKAELKAKLEAMSPADRKAYKKKLAVEKSMADQPKLL